MILLSVGIFAIHSTVGDFYFPTEIYGWQYLWGWVFKQIIDKISEDAGTQ